MEPEHFGRIDGRQRLRKRGVVVVRVARRAAVAKVVFDFLERFRRPEGEARLRRRGRQPLVRVGSEQASV